jgi:signal transduction histidine kinase
LLVNAGRRTRNGHVAVSASIREGLLAFDVADNGPGIPAAALRELLRPFTPADADHATGLEGGRLGLALSRRLCRKMGGELGARSEPGHGTVFTVTVPATPATHAAAVAPAAPASTAVTTHAGQSAANAPAAPATDRVGGAIDA